MEKVILKSDQRVITRDHFICLCKELASVAKQTFDAPCSERVTLYRGPRKAYTGRPGEMSLSQAIDYNNSLILLRTQELEGVTPDAWDRAAEAVVVFKPNGGQSHIESISEVDFHKRTPSKLQCIVIGEEKPGLMRSLIAKVCPQMRISLGL